MANPGANDAGWRLHMSREDRIKVCQHIMGKLATYYHMVPPQALREKTSAFESQAYTNAESRTDYLKRIAGGLSNVERQVQTSSENATGHNPPGGGNPPAGASAASQMQGAQARAGLTQQAAQQLQQHQLLRAQGQIPSDQYIRQQHLLMQQQQHAKQQLAAKAAAERVKAGSAADAKKAANNRTRSSSSSAAAGSASARSNAQHGQNQAMAKGMGPQSAAGRAAGFGGVQGAAGNAAMTPEYLLAHSQYSQQALQAAQAAQLARQQNGQTQGTNGQGGVGAMGLNVSAAAKTGGRVPGVGNPGVAGFLQSNFPGDLSRKFSPEQLNQLSTMTNPQNTLGLQPNVPGGVSGALPVGTGSGTDSRVSAQMLRSNPLHQGHGMQAGNPNNSFVRAAMAGSGMSVSEMKAMMAQTSQTANPDTLRAAQQGYGNFPDVRARMNQSAAAGQRMPNPAGSGSAADDQFWEKLDFMKKKYSAALHRIAPITHIIADGQPPPKQEQFRKHLKDCFHILRLERTDAVSPRLTIVLLEKAERFIQSVIQVYHKLNTASKDKQAAAARARAANGAAGAAGQANMLQSQQFARQAAAHASPQNQQHQNMQFMNHLQQQHHLNQLPGTVGMSTAAKNAKANAGRVPNRAQHGRVPRGQPPSTALMGGQPGMPIKPEQLASGMNPYALPTPAAGSEQDLKLLQQQHRQMLQAQQAQQAQQHHNAHLPQSFQHPGAAQGARGKLQSQLAHGNPAMDGARMDPMQMQQFHEQLRRKKYMQQAQGVNGAAGLGNQVAGVKHQRSQGLDPTIAKTEGALGTPGSRVVPTPAPGSRRAPGATLEQKMQHMQSSVKIAVERAERLEQYLEKEVMRGKAERIQNTLAALRNGSNSTGVGNGKKRGLRHTSLVDVENQTDEKDMIKAKTIFEVTSEVGLRLAKRPKNETADIKSLKEAVEADCRSAQERNPLLSIEITEEFGQPVVTCQLLIEDVKLPKLILRVQRGYPRKGGATFGFERPPLGWVGVLEEIRTRFKRSLANAPATSVGVAAFLDAWAREAEEVVDQKLRSHLKPAKLEDKLEDTLSKSVEPLKAT